MVRSKEITPDRENLRKNTVFFPEVLENYPPNMWWGILARRVIGFERYVIPTLSDDPLKISCLEKTQQVKKILREVSVRRLDSKEKIIELTEHKMMELSMMMASSFEPKELELKTYFVPLNELVESNKDRFALEHGILNGVSVQYLRMKNPDNSLLVTVPLPIAKKIWHKGGASRLALDIYAKAPEIMQKNEFPLNDLDILSAEKSSEAHKIAIAIGVDPDGVEHMGEPNLNFTRFCFGRDTTQNQVCLGSEGLYYSDPAFLAAKTGMTEIIGEYIANKAIYGIDRVVIEGISLAKPRGLMRLVKAVAEQKALTFPYKMANSNFDMGIYALFLAKKWSKKEKFPDFLERMFYLMDQMKQTKPKEKDAIALLERAHREYPFFDFDKEVVSLEDLAKWKAKKFVKQIDREFAWVFGFPTTLHLKRRENDTIPKIISLDGFISDPSFAGKTAKWWEKFINESRERVKAFDKKNLSFYDRIFFKEEDYDDMTVYNIDE